MPDPQTIVLAAGGTGGHLFPAEALAQELLKRGHKVVIFTDKRGNAFKSLGDRAPIHIVSAATMRAGILPKLKAIFDMAVGIGQSFGLLRRIKPALVVGFGGYPSFPGVFSAQLMGIPTVLHEQNAVLGRANKVLAGRADEIALSLPGTRGIAAKDQPKAAVTGNPVRADIVAVRDSAYQPPAGDMRIFITGGSQAAKVFADIMPAAAARLPDAFKSRLAIVHQCREDTIAETEKRYTAANIKAEIKSFFGDMPERLKTCQLFIGRAGASTVAEIAAVGRPALFVPYPGHADMQQKYNAEVISGHGGAWVMLQDGFTAEAVADKLQQFMQDPAILEKAAAAAKACGQPGAAANLADLVEKRLTLKT